MAGFEGELSYDIGILFDWNFQLKLYANFVRLTKYKDKETDEDLKYTSDWNVSDGITLSDYNDLSAKLNIAYIGKQDIDDWRAGYPAPVVEKGCFQVANLTISKKIVDTENFGDVTLKAEIENLFDKDYEYVNDYPMPERSFFLGLRYDY